MIRAVIFDLFETLITHYQSPLYFGAEMAKDAWIPLERFLPLWRKTEYDRTVGHVTLESVLTQILLENGRYSQALLNKLTEKRIAAKIACFDHLHPQIIPMLEALKAQNVQIGLISNCFSEEAAVFRKSKLCPYFDVVCLSYEQGVQKPDREIFLRCLDQFSLHAKDCLYIGDGGSYELEAAKGLGMQAMQAAWYLKDGTTQPTGRKEDFIQLEVPLDVLDYLDSNEK